jgi:hypothetical protein
VPKICSVGARYHLEKPPLLVPMASWSSFRLCLPWTVFRASTVSGDLRCDESMRYKGRNMHEANYPATWRRLLRERIRLNLYREKGISFN